MQTANVSQAKTLDAARQQAIDLIHQSDGFMLVTTLDPGKTDLSFGFQMYGETARLNQAVTNSMDASREVKTFIIEAAMREVQP